MARRSRRCLEEAGASVANEATGASTESVLSILSFGALSSEGGRG